MMRMNSNGKFPNDKKRNGKLKDTKMLREAEKG